MASYPHQQPSLNIKQTTPLLNQNKALFSPRFNLKQNYTFLNPRHNKHSKNSYPPTPAHKTSLTISPGQKHSTKKTRISIFTDTSRFITNNTSCHHQFAFLYNSPTFYSPLKTNYKTYTINIELHFPQISAQHYYHCQRQYHTLITIGIYR